MLPTVEEVLYVFSLEDEGLTIVGDFDRVVGGGMDAKANVAGSGRQAVAANLAAAVGSPGSRLHFPSTICWMRPQA